jgi:hypothetical protein
MNTQEQLIAQGYKKHVSSHYSTFKTTDTLYQKLIADDIGKLYYINAWWYPSATYGTTVVEDAVQFEVQFNDQDENAIMDVVLFEKMLARQRYTFVTCTLC